MSTIYNNLSSASGFINLNRPTESFICSIDTGTALVKSGNGILTGLTINSHSSGVMALYDGTSVAGNVMHSSITFGAAERTIDFQNERFTTGLFIDATGTMSVTIRYK